MALVISKFRKTFSFRSFAAHIWTRHMCQGRDTHCEGMPKAPKGLVLGFYESDPGVLCQSCQHFTLTSAANKYNDITKGRLLDLIEKSGVHRRLGVPRVFYDLDPEFALVAVVNLGVKCAGFNSTEERDDKKEFIRIAAALATTALQELDVEKIFVESFGHAESAAEGAALSIYVYQELRNKKKQITIPILELYEDCDWASWNIGLHKASAQNLARQLAELPANVLTPRAFAKMAVETLCKAGLNVEVKVRRWAEAQRMGAFLAVGKGSCHDPIFLEISYYGTDFEERPIVLIGKGVTFDSGGLCLRDRYNMRNMRADMSGAACVVATSKALADMQIPLNIRGLIPLCENMPGCYAYKPGDILTAINGKSIVVEDTCSEGPLIVADTLYYAQNFWPKFIIDIGTMTEDARTSVGTAATPVYTNSDRLWTKLRLAGIHTGDRVWRHPLWEYYGNLVKKSGEADLQNVGEGDGGFMSRMAAFLREFVPCGEWIHLDTYGVMTANGIDHVYLRKGMSGRPTRTLLEFLLHIVCKECPPRYEWNY